MQKSKAVWATYGKLVEHDRFVALWNEGVQCKDIGKIFGMSSSAASKYAKRFREECPTRTVRERISGINEEHFIEMWNAGEKCEVMAKEFGISLTSVSRLARTTYGGKCKTRHSWKILQENHEEFVQMWNEGVTCSKMAKHFNVKLKSIENYASRCRDECPKRK